MHCPRPLATLLLLLLIGLSPLRAQQSLPPGEHVIDVPAMTDGLCLHNLFQSNMVLQRERPIAVWGWATTGDTVRVSFAGQTQTATAAADRRWRVSFPAMAAASTPTEMTVTAGDQTIVLENILIGDVWLLGGQSNMEHPISRVEGGEIEIMSASLPNLRLLTVPAQDGPEPKANFPRLHEWSGFFNRHYRKGDWDICSPETVPEFSAIGYAFARRLHMSTGVPIGVIDMSRGGTCIETWVPRAMLDEMETPEVRARLAEWDAKVAAYSPEKSLADRVARWERRMNERRARGETIPDDAQPPTEPSPSPLQDMNLPGNSYASMLTPIAGLPITGAIWHQGFNNAMQPEGHVMYRQIFPRLIETWRRDFGDPDMPFGIISLCTVGDPQTLDNYLEKMIDEGIYVRAVQYETYARLTAAGDANIGFASSYDLRRAWYHPQLKIPAAERIARWALATQYGYEKLAWKPPVITATEAVDGALRLAFDVPVGAPGGFAMEGFAIAGDDRRYQPATATYLEEGRDGRNRPKYNQRVLVLTSPHVPNPTHFRYAWGRNPMGNIHPLFTPDGPVLGTQRSDDWRITDVPISFGDTVDRATLDRIRQAHALFDRERRIKDARALLDAEATETTKAVEAFWAEYQP